ncbi:MAG: 50S ribosomal protein L32 [Candidatus Bathyarchaeia archaeon]
MPVPKRKYPKSRQGKRRSHLALNAPPLVNCPQCHTPKLSHHVCPTCGTYEGRDVLKIEQKGKSTS